MSEEYHQTAEQQYLQTCWRVINEGVVVHNERTNVNTKTIINVDLEYGAKDFPILTTKRCYWKSAIAEVLGYIRGYNDAGAFRELGTNTWNANANDNESWLNNENRRGTDDMGRVYGVQGRGWLKPAEYLSIDDQTTVDQLRKVVEDLSKGVDDRGEIVTFWNPGEFELGCLRPCMHSYQFSLLNGVLYLNVTQRSGDLPLGVPFNMIQGYVMLMLIAKLTGHEMGTIYHKIVNAHVYENQIDPLMVQLKRSYKQSDSTASLHLLTEINTIEDLEKVTVDDFELRDYRYQDAIKFPFSV